MATECKNRAEPSLLVAIPYMKSGFEVELPELGVRHNSSSRYRVPQMVVRIDDRQIGLEDWFLAPIEPVLADGKIVEGRRGGERRRG